MTDKQIDGALEAIKRFVDTHYKPDEQYWGELHLHLETLDQALERQRVPLEWKQHERDGGIHTEWTAPCGCAYHPEPFPHVHPCSDAHKRPDLHDGERQRVPEGYSVVHIESCAREIYERITRTGAYRDAKVPFDALAEVRQLLAAAPEPD